MGRARLLGRFGSFGSFGDYFAGFLDQRGSLAEALAQVSELGPAHFAMTFDFDLVHARGVDGENTLDTFAVADAAHAEHFIQSVPIGGDVSAPVFSNVMSQALRMSSVSPDAETLREAVAPMAPTSNAAKERG